MPRTVSQTRRNIFPLEDQSVMMVADNRVGVTVRLAEPRDCASMAELIGQLGYSVSPEEVAARLEAVHDHGHPVFIAERHGEIAGCLTTSVMQVLHRPAPVGRIAMLVVDETLRGQGIGSALAARQHNGAARQRRHK